jgi:hypothetical protein
MEKVTPEDCYRQWHKEVQRKRGINVKPVKNFNNAKKKSYWSSFEAFANLCNRNNGQVNYKLYITALVEHHGGYFDPSILPSRKSIKIYKSFIKEQEMSSSPEYIKNAIFTSLKFVISYCTKNNIDTLDQYLSEDLHLIPTPLRHHNAGSVSLYFLACIKNYDMILASYTAGIAGDYIPDFKESYPLYRVRVLNTNLKEVTNLANNLEKILNLMIEKVKKGEQK